MFEDSVWSAYSSVSKKYVAIAPKTRSDILVRNFGFNQFAIGANSEWVEFDVKNGIRQAFFITKQSYLTKYFKREFFHDFVQNKKQVFYPNRIYKSDSPFDQPIVDRPKVTDKLIFSHQENEAEFGYGDAYFPGTGRCIFFALGNLLALQNVILNHPDFTGNLDYRFENSGFYPFDIAAHNIFYLITQYPEWMKKNFPKIDKESLYDGIVSSGCDHFVKFYNAMISQPTTESLEAPYVLGFSEEEFWDVIQNNVQDKDSIQVQLFLSKLTTTGRACCLLTITLNQDRHVICLDIDFNRKDSDQIIFRDSMRRLYKLPFWLYGKEYGEGGYVADGFDSFWSATKNINQIPANAPEEVKEMINLKLPLYKKISAALKKISKEYLSQKKLKK